MRRGVLAAALGLVFTVCVCSAAEVELTAANKTVNEDVTSYSGDVTLKVPAGAPMQLRGKAMKRERGVEIVRGEVEIKLEKLLVRTQQASVTRNEQFTVVKMDAAEVTAIKP